MICEVPGCENEHDLVYAVDPTKPDKHICAPCVGRWSPQALDSLLNVKQDYTQPLPGTKPHVLAEPTAGSGEASTQ